MNETLPATNDEGQPHPSPAGDVLEAADRQLSRRLAAFTVLWLLAGTVSALFHLTIEPKADNGGSTAFTDELKLIADMASTHGNVLREVMDKPLDSPESFAELDTDLAKHKQTLRDLSLVSVQDPWSRDPLVTLRRDLIESYYQVQGDLEKMHALPEGSARRQDLFRDAIDRLQTRRQRIVETTRQLGIRPQEVKIEADTRQRIYGIAEEISFTAPR